MFNQNTSILPCGITGGIVNVQKHRKHEDSMKFHDAGRKCLRQGVIITPELWFFKRAHKSTKYHKLHQCSIEPNYFKSLFHTKKVKDCQIDQGSKWISGKVHCHFFISVFLEKIEPGNSEPDWCFFVLPFITEVLLELILETSFVKQMTHIRERQNLGTWCY